MKAVLLRTGSLPVHSSPMCSSPRVSSTDRDFVSGILFSGGNSVRCCLHLEITDKKKKKEEVKKESCIRRTRSEADVIRSVNKVPCSFTESRSRYIPSRIPEEDEDVEEGSLVLKKKNLDRLIDYSGGGVGKGRNVGGGNSGGGGALGGGNADQRNMSEYYRKLLEANPGNPLILRNYGKYLHEVKGDMVKAEECYSRAILAGSGDGEVLSLYGKFIWESSGDAVRAESYFDQAVQAAPDDCYVMGSYANFLWSAEEEDDEEETAEVRLTVTSNLVEAC